MRGRGVFAWPAKAATVTDAMTPDLSQLKERCAALHERLEAFGRYL